jgi:hypothetical protein
MTIPTRQWFPVDITGSLGSFEAWNTSTIDAEVMVSSIIAYLSTFVPSSFHFDAATVYTQADAEAPNIPQRSIALSDVGSSTNTGNSQAVSCTWNFKTTANGNAKLVLLDVPLRASWLRRLTAADFTSDDNGLATTFMSDTNAFSGRDDTKPSVFRSITFDVNDKLQRAYFG